MKIGIRAADLDDREFVISTWSRGYKASRQAGIIASDRWADVMHPTIARLLDRPNTRTLIAFEQDDPDFIYAFAAGDTSNDVPIVYFAYTKDGFRREGCARSLFGALGIDPLQHFAYPCWTPFVLKLKDAIPLAKHIVNVARYDDMRSIDAWRP